jgi:hypothetical protein
MKGKAGEAKEFDKVLRAMLTTKPLSKEEIRARIGARRKATQKEKQVVRVEAVERLEGDQGLIGQRSRVEHAVQGQVEDRRLQATTIVSPAELSHVAVQMPGTEFVVVADYGPLEQ